MTATVLISEVGPRNGLHRAARTMPLAGKLARVPALHGPGLGRCPHAPVALGDVVTEEPMFLFEGLGVHTGLGLQRLVASRVDLQQGPPGEPLHSMRPEAGLPAGSSSPSRPAIPAGHRPTSSSDKGK